MFGNPNLEAARVKAAQTLRTPAPAEVVTLMRELRDNSATLRDIASKLNGLGIKTQRGNIWYTGTVPAELQRAATA